MWTSIIHALSGVSSRRLSVGDLQSTGGRVDTSGHFFIVSNHKVFYDVAFRSSLGIFWYVKKVCFAKKRICVFIINGPNRWVL